MQHLTEEQLVAHYYRDDDAPGAATEHLAACAGCAAEFDSITRVLALVKDAPVPERGDEYGEQVWTRLRWRLGAPSRRKQWQWLAVAAVMAMGLCTGVVWNGRHTPNQANVARVSAPALPSHAGTIAGATQNQRVLVVVVSDHLEASERMLTDVSNADPTKTFDAEAQQERAAELVASNRIYRQTALQRGDERIASLLSDLEPILVELAHAGKTLSPDELASIQKRIESKGLLFKVRVMSAQTGGGDRVPAAPAGNSL
ncbi:MAG TPA: hypothetical protein VH087_07475 [Thermoanaerobaculia bacterium]|jgi:hypothetical protein|nr:hypothetical protein [Thermoanaerobaculia bacterium]